MTRALQLAGAVVGALLLGASAAFLWASSGRVSEDQLAQITDYPAPPASPARDTFTVMTYNLGHLAGPGKDVPASDSLYHANLDRALSLIRRADPDFIGFQEINFGAARFAGLSQLDTIATALNYTSGARAVNWNERFLPYTPFGAVLSGQALLSRYSVRQQVRTELPRPSLSVLRDAFYFDRLVQVAVVDIGGWPLILMNVHLEASDRKTREKQARKIKMLYKRLEQYGFPILLFGTLNSVRPSARSALPQRVRRQFTNDETMEILLRTTTLKPAFSEGAYVTGTSLDTYPADNPRLKIDYIFYRPRRIIPINSEVRCGPSSAPPSDHCAVSMSFLLPRPKKKLPDERIPDSKLPSLDSLLHAPPPNGSPSK